MRLAIEIAALTLLLLAWEVTRRRKRHYVRWLEESSVALKTLHEALETLPPPEAIQQMLDRLGLRMEDVEVIRVPLHSPEKMAERLRRMMEGKCPICGGDHPRFGSEATEPTEGTPSGSGGS